MASKLKTNTAAGTGDKARVEDVARLANVSAATVSRVLNHPQMVREALREKVTRAITELSYTPDSAARALMSRKSRTMGVVVPTLGNHIFAEGIEALQSRLSEHGYTLLIASSQYDSKRELQEIRTLVERGVDGIILVGNSHLPATYELIKRHGIPFLTTYVCRSEEGVSAIGIDNENATYDLTRYLLGLGHREFGVIANMQAVSDRTHARVRGVKRALVEGNVTLLDSQVVNFNHTLAHGRLGLQELLKINPSITAVICTTDTLAFGAMAEARSMGIKVPQNLSITGFDDIELSSQFEPPLTTISMPAAEICRAAADHLVNAIAGMPIPLAIELPYRLIIRASTGTPRFK